MMMVPIVNVLKFAISSARGTLRAASPVSSPAVPFMSKPEITKTGTEQGEQERPGTWNGRAPSTPSVEVSTLTLLKCAEVKMTATRTPMITMAIARNSAATPTLLLNQAAIFTAVRLSTVRRSDEDRGEAERLPVAGQRDVEPAQDERRDAVGLGR